MNPSDLNWRHIAAGLVIFTAAAALCIFAAASISLIYRLDTISLPEPTPQQSVRTGMADDSIIPLGSVLGGLAGIGWIILASRARRPRGPWAARLNARVSGMVLGIGATVVLHLGFATIDAEPVADPADLPRSIAALLDALNPAMLALGVLIGLMSGAELGGIAGWLWDIARPRAARQFSPIAADDRQSLWGIVAASYGLAVVPALTLALISAAPQALMLALPVGFTLNGGLATLFTLSRALSHRIEQAHEPIPSNHAPDDPTRATD